MWTIALVMMSGSLWSGPAREARVEELRAAVERHEAAPWYPRVIDAEAGGYWADFNFRWEREAGPQAKMIVTQARHVWSLATLAEFYGEEQPWRGWAEHGRSFLESKMWDAEHGGFWWLVSREGEPLAEGDGRRMKRAYGQAFGIYACAAMYRSFGDTRALDLAQRTFAWMEAHAHDPVHGGYFEWMEEDGRARREGYGGAPAKDYNSSIHLLEALTELVGVWPDPQARARLEEMFRVVRDSLRDERGFLRLAVGADWRAVPRASGGAGVSFGHDVETAFLLVEAEAVLEGRASEATWAVGEGMVEHALRFGWDKERGGFWEEGEYANGAEVPEVTDGRKNWWAQAEGLHTLLLLARRHAGTEAGRRYAAAWERQWDYIRKYLLDEEHGGWHPWGTEVSPEAARARKAQVWKANYHTLRALTRCSKILDTYENHDIP